jgi:hypothetical protein
LRYRHEQKAITEKKAKSRKSVTHRCWPLLHTGLQNRT